MRIKDYLEARKPLRNIQRFSMEYCITKQNLPEHGYHVANLFYTSCVECGLDVKAEELFVVMNHDFLESKTGDLNHAVKNKNEVTKTTWVMLENEVTTAHLRKYLDQELEFTLGVNRHHILLFCDAMDAFLYLREEAAMGNVSMKSIESYYKENLQRMVAESPTANIRAGLNIVAEACNVF